MKICLIFNWKKKNAFIENLVNCFLDSFRSNWYNVSFIGLLYNNVNISRFLMLMHHTSHVQIHYVILEQCHIWLINKYIIIHNNNNHRIQIGRNLFSPFIENMCIYVLLCILYQIYIYLYIFSINICFNTAFIWHAGDKKNLLIFVTHEYDISPWSVIWHSYASQNWVSFFISSVLYIFYTNVDVWCVVNLSKERRTSNRCNSSKSLRLIVPNLIIPKLWMIVEKFIVLMNWSVFVTVPVYSLWRGTILHFIQFHHQIDI